MCCLPASNVCNLVHYSEICNVQCEHWISCKQDHLNCSADDFLQCNRVPLPTQSTATTIWRELLCSAAVNCCIAKCVKLLIGALLLFVGPDPLLHTSIAFNSNANQNQSNFTTKLENQTNLNPFLISGWFPL